MEGKTMTKKEQVKLEKAKKILHNLEDKCNIDYCGLDYWELVGIVMNSL